MKSNCLKNCEIFILIIYIYIINILKKNYLINKSIDIYYFILIFLVLSK